MDAGLMAQYRSVLSEDERQKADRFRFEKDRKLSVTARALVRYILSECTGNPPESFSFRENRFGKPSLVGNPSPVDGTILPDLRFNLSHSKGMVVCALALGRDVGVDVESMERTVELSIARRFFSRAEAEFLEGCPEKDKTACFFDIWTLKEAFIKARGMGLSIPLDAFSFCLSDPTPRIRFHDPEAAGGAGPEAWQFFRWQPRTGAMVAACIQGTPPVEVHRFFCTPFKEMRLDKK
ncbi:MAG: 4'-phosphopantetheinyl transferase superfamily protein [Desulfobacterales bacterium]|nr:4'-phosphopantetheinyl transferase superfamily protein [Desulfobacterales bacterium]